MKKWNRIAAAALASAALFTLSAAPVQAGYFPDVADPAVSQAADTLAALGVVSGNDAGHFLPDAPLTRAAFCKMAIELMGKGEQAKAQMNRTIFTDVGSTHWGRGYINLAATMVIDESAGLRLMTGVGNGKFEPNRSISYQEAVTLILRILGYAAEAAASWPSGAIQTASELGLDQGLDIRSYSAVIDRGQAAILLTRMLAVSPKGGSKPYAAQLGSLVEDVIVLSVNATVNGQSGWVTTSGGGAYRPAGQADDQLVGQRGDALLDQSGRFVTLLTDASNCVTVTISRTQGNYLHASNGARYTFESSTPVYVGATGAASTYAEMLPSLTAGDVVTIYLDGGRVVGMFCAAATAESGFVIAGASSSPADFYSITGNDFSYTIRKNGSTITMSEIKAYDVATYDPVSKVLHVCDTRLTCVYENVSPSPLAPSVITACGGNTFRVMANAMDSITQYQLGQSFTLLFTADGLVAGAVGGGWGGYSAVGGNAIGVVSGTSLKLIGTNVTLAVDAASAAAYAGQLVSVSGSRGQLTLTPLDLSYAPGNFDRTTMRLGALMVSDSVQIYEQGASGLSPVSLSALPAAIPAAKISGYRANASGYVDLIVLRSVTGDGYSYGLIQPASRTEQVNKKGLAPYIRQENGGYLDKNGSAVDADGNLLDSSGKIITEQKTIQQLKFVTPGGVKTYDTASGLGVSSCFGTISTYRDSETGAEYALVQSTLTAIRDVRSANFYTMDGTTYVRANNATYEVSADVMCYNSAASGGWWTSNPDPTGPDDQWLYVTENQWFDSLLAARTFADTLTIYVDPVGGKVRAVSTQ